MAKYYVQSGTLRTIVQAESARRAALWAVHQAMQQVLPMEVADPAPSTATNEQISGGGVAVLSGTVRISERGFDNSDAATMLTMDVVNEWNQLVTTLDRLERMLHVAR